MPQTTEVLEYVRGSHRRKRGVMIARVKPGTNQVFFGWSLCHKKLDTFDMKVALALAEQRMKNNSTIPESMHKKFRRFYQRWIRFFKDKEIMTAVDETYTGHEQHGGDITPGYLKMSLINHKS